MLAGVLEEGSLGPTEIFAGFEHDCDSPCVSLNKDAPDEPAGPVLHERARSLATLQRSYEWCRLVRAAGLDRRDGLLLTMLVGNRGDPRPRGTPCARTAPPGGDVAVVVNILGVRVRHDGDDGNPGEIQLSAALYEWSSPLRRLVRSQSRFGSVKRSNGDEFPRSRLPPPLALCVPQGTTATFALHGWDNDDDAGDPASQRLDFDDNGDDDTLLRGFQVRLDAAKPPRGRRVAGVAADSDLEVSFRVGRAIPPPPGRPAHRPPCTDVTKSPRSIALQRIIH